MIEVVRCSAFVTVQDLGWSTGRAIGLPRAGAMDAAALELANALVGNDDDGAGLEIALGGLVVRFSRAVRIALTGGRARVTVAGNEVAFDTTLFVAPGEPLAIEPIVKDRFLYLAVDGGIAVPPVLGSRSTYLPTGLGGAGGRRLATGDQLPLGDPVSFGPPAGTHTFEPEDRLGSVRIVPGPQAHLFDPATRAHLEDQRFTVLPGSDRMGTRLRGPAIVPTTPASQPSEATCLGAIQIPDGGQPIVLLADGPTVGGYPKIGAVIGADVGRFAQTALGGTIGFEWVTVAEAQRLRYEAAEHLTRRLTAIRATARAT